MNTGGLTDNPAFWAEVGLLLLTLVMAAAAARPVNGVVGRLEAGARAIADRPAMAILAVFLFTVLARVALLPVLELPQSAGADSSSLMLQAETLLKGRLANPPHALSQFFESAYVHQAPTYGSMYFPGRGLALALGLLLFHSPGAGVVLCMGLAAAAMVWMLRAWVGPTAALVGGLLFACRIALFSVWANTLVGAEGTVIGGALVLGAYGRLRRRVTWGQATLLGAGLLLTVITRPYESALMCLPLGLATAWRLLGWLRQGQTAPVVRLATPVAVLLAATLVILLGYDLANTGSALKAPYSLNRTEYAGTPAFVFGKATTPTRAMPPALANYYKVEGEGYFKAKTPAGFARSTIAKARNAWAFFIGPLLTIPFLLGLAFLRRNLDLAAGLGVLMLGFAPVQFSWSHYLAPAAGLFMVIITAGLVRMRAYGERGLALSRMLPTAVALSTAIPVSHLLTGMPALQPTAFFSCCSLNNAFDRRPLERRLLAEPGRHLVFVGSAVAGIGWNQWVFNDADIDDSRIVWAHDLGRDEDRKLMAYYPRRTVWLADGTTVRKVRSGDAG